MTQQQANAVDKALRAKGINACPMCGMVSMHIAGEEGVTTLPALVVDLSTVRLPTGTEIESGLPIDCAVVRCRNCGFLSLYPFSEPPLSDM